MKKVFTLSLLTGAFIYLTAPLMFGKDYGNGNKVTGLSGPTGPTSSSVAPPGRPLTDSARNYYHTDKQAQEHPLTDSIKNYYFLYPPGSPQRIALDSVKARRDAQTKTDQMENELHLSTVQFPRVFQINVDYLTQLYKLNSMVSSTHPAQLDKIKELKDKRSQALNSILTTEQSEQLKKLHPDN